MAETKAALFLKVKQALRTHPDWTDKKVAEYTGLRLPMEQDILREARKEMANQADWTPRNLS